MPTLLFVGGCHVTGYPAGVERGFAAHCSRRLGKGYVVKSQGLVKLIRPERVEAACNSDDIEALILQMGHFELTVELKRWLLRRKPEGSGTPSAVSVSPFLTPEGQARWAVKAWAKAAIDTMLGHPMVDFEAFGGELDRFTERISRLPTGCKVLLSPLPCADLTALYYRRQAAADYAAAARRHGLHYLNVLETELGDPRRGRRYFYDSIHLNEAGHTLLGKLLAEFLAPLLKVPVAGAIHQRS